MASDNVLIHQLVNPCCRALKERYSKLEAKRKALREGVKIQTELIDKLQIENLTLKKAYEEEKVRGDAERLEKSKESTARVSLEKEIDVLKTEIDSLHQRGEDLGSRAQDDFDLLLLRTHLSEKEAEIEKLKEELVEKTKVRADAEREEKYNESSNRVLLEKEIVVLKSEIHSLQQRECSKSNAQVDSEISLLLTRHAEMEEEIKKLKQLIEEEKIRTDAERQAKDKELANRVSLGKEIDVLKAEIHTLHQREGSKSNTQVDSEISLLLTRHAEMEEEIKRLKELIEEEKIRTDAERQAKDKELANRDSVGKEIDVLKAEIHSLHQRESSKSEAQESELLVLRARHAEMEAETDKLKNLLEKERMNSDTQRKRADAEKKGATKVNQVLKVEKSKIDEERKRTEAERKKVEENRVLLEKLKSEAEEARSRLVVETLKSEEANKKLELERQKAFDEKRRVDLGMAKVEEQKKLAEMYKKKANDEKRRVDHLSQQLEEHKQKNQNLQMQVQENVSSKTEKVNERVGEEKQKVIRERKRADSEMKRAELLKKVAEVNEKKALEEKHRADQLARQLEDQARKIDQLQTEKSIFRSSRPSFEASVVNSDMNINSKAAELEMTRKHLKLLKKQVKHAKEVAKLERDRKDLLQQKLGTITYEFVQFLHRINVLDDCFTQTTEGRERSNKNNVCNSSGSNLQRELLSKYPNLVHYCQDNGPIMYTPLAIDITGTSKLALNCSATLPPACGGNSTHCISGIDSKMDSQLRCSERKKLESYAINSTMASFSDRPLMASQGKGSLAVTTSAKIPEGNTNRQSKGHNVAALAENSGQSLLKTDGTKSGKPSRKRKNIIEAVKSIESLYSEGKNWQMRVEGKLSNLHGILQSQMDKCSRDKSDLEQYPEQIRAKKRKKELSVEEVAMRRSDENCKDINGIGGTEVYNKTVLPDKDLRDADPACGDGKCDFGRHGREIGCFEEVIQGNFMKLLDLDDAVDEECYRRALERPMSPFVPVIEFQMSDTTGHRSGNYILDKCHHEGFLRETDNLVQSCSYDLVNMDINKLKLSRKEIHHDASLSKNDDSVCVTRDVINRNCKGRAVYEDIAFDHHIRESKKVLESSDYVTTVSCQSTRQLSSDKPPKYCVVFSENEHESRISRIYNAVKTCIDQCSVTFDMDEAMLKLMFFTLKMEELSPRERASVVFSVLLNFSETTSEVWNLWPTDFIRLSDFLARCLRAVLSDAETRSRFAELCFSGELLMLIEEFLLDRRLLVYTDVSSNSLPISGFRMNILLDEKQIVLSRTLASRCQLLPGTLILASICAAIDHIGILCEASHNIFRLRKLDNSLMLDILHVFAYVCGPKYFVIENYSLTMTVVRSLVALLERESVKKGHACCLSSSVKVCEGSTSLRTCPFSEVAVSMDVVISMLLEKLQNYVLSGFASHNVEPVSHQNNKHHIEAYGLHPTSCSEDCCLKKSELATGQSASIYDQNICHFTDIISLVELVANNMHWDWTCKQIIPQMLKSLDSCPLGNFFIVIVIFLGNLGRLGVDASGYDDKGVESVRSRLFALLKQNSAKEFAFATQIVIINALVSIIPVKFEKLVKTSAEIPSIASYIGFANYIRNWYSTLSSEQQSLSLDLLE